jgi:hypothetical protein
MHCRGGKYYQKFYRIGVLSTNRTRSYFETCARMSTMCFPRYFSRHGKYGNGKRQRVSPSNRETSGRGAWSRKVRRGQAGRTGPAQQWRAAGACTAFGVDPKEPAQKWAGTQAGTYCAVGAGWRTWGQHKGGGRQVRAADACGAPGNNPRD